MSGFMAMHFGAALEKGLARKNQEESNYRMLCRSCNSDADQKIEQNFGHKIEVIKTCSQQE